MPDAVAKRSNIAAPPKPPDREALVPVVLSVRDLSVRLGGRQVLRHVNFEVAAGEVTGLIGANGAGKTTLIRTVLGLQVASAGSVERARVGYVPQKVVLDPDLPVRSRDLVGLGLKRHERRASWPSGRRRAQVEQLLAAVGALHLADARVGTLSGGEQQRVLIAHALASEPQLLLLDEPLANLDPASTQAVVKLLAQLAGSRAMGILVSTHDMNPLLPFMHKVVYLAGGLAASGTTEQVVRSDVLSALYGHHVDVLRAHGRVIVSVADEHREEGCETVAGTGPRLGPLPGPCSMGELPDGAREAATANGTTDGGCELAPDDCGPSTPRLASQRATKAAPVAQTAAEAGRGPT